MEYYREPSMRFREKTQDGRQVDPTDNEYSEPRGDTGRL